MYQIMDGNTEDGRAIPDHHTDGALPSQMPMPDTE